MRDKEYFMRTLRPVLTSLTEAELERYAEKMEENYKYVKIGDNVIHLEYYSPLITKDEIFKIEESLTKHNIELSHYDKLGIPQASLEDFALQMFLVINDKISQELLSGISTNALWDAIKTTMVYIWDKVKNRTLSSLTSKGIAETKINFGLTLNLDKQTQLDFKLDGDISEELVLQSLDKVLDFVKETKRNNVLEHNNFIVYNKKTQKWERINVSGEINKIIKSKRK